MKIQFSNPPWWEVTADQQLRQGIRAGSRWPFTRPAAHAPDQFRPGGYLPFPLFLAHAAGHTAAALPEAEVEVRDSITRGESYRTWLTALAANPPDWLIIETATAAWKHDSTLMAQLGQFAPGIRIILAGPIDPAKHTEILQNHPSIAAIVCGEYDQQIPRVINAAAAPDYVPRVFPHALLTREQLAASPLPIWDEPAALNYHDSCPPLPAHLRSPDSDRRSPQLTLWTSRGCPHKCIFCVWPAVMTGHDPDGSHARTVRFYPPAYIERHIRARLAAAEAAGRPYRTIYLDDDTFNLSPKHTREICEVLARIGLPWSAMCRADTIDREHWQLMKDSGCYGVKLGFETGSQYVADHIINKKLDLTSAAQTARMLKQEIGLTVHGTFTIGLPGETPAQAQETRLFIDLLYTMGALDSHQLSGTAEIEGTPLHTLATAKHLEAYSAAALDENYLPGADGQAKIEHLTRALPQPTTHQPSVLPIDTDC